MSYSRTLSIIKPNAVEKGAAGKIISMFEENSFDIIAQKKLRLTKDEAGKFYEVHKDRPFFNSLITFMISGPIVVQVLAKRNAVLENRELMGATNPKEAKKGTIRNIYGEDIERNAVHGSDSDENAKTEIAFFFSECEIL